MDASGRDRRMRRLFDPGSRRTVLLPIDQPVTLGPIAGLVSAERDVHPLLAAGPDALIAHPGMLRRIPAALTPRTGLVLHLSAGTTLSTRAHVKVRTATVTDAVRAGLDAVSVQVTFGVPEESAMLAELASVCSLGAEWGVPVLAMVYVMGVDEAGAPATVAHAARVAAELGADVVKVPYTGSADSFAAVVEGCFVPVVVAGGERSFWDGVVVMVKEALSVGAAGVCIGRNVFQHSEPASALAQLRQLVHAPPGRPWTGG
jgi:class I fructose-bisphosphate aldolase